MNVSAEGIEDGKGGYQPDRDLNPKPGDDLSEYPYIGGDLDINPDMKGDLIKDPDTGGDPDPEGRTRWEKAQIAFTMLKVKIANTPILKHFDPDRPPVIVVYASKWAVSAALLQEFEGMYWPVTFTSRTLKPNEINYGMVEKEVLALLRILDV